MNIASPKQVHITYEQERTTASDKLAEKRRPTKSKVTDNGLFWHTIYRPANI